MADEIILNASDGLGDKVAVDEIAGRKHQRVKVQHGADGAATDVSAASPMPVTDATVLAKLTTIDADTSKITACNTGAVVVASGTITTITDAVAVTGTFWQATQPVSGTFWQATQPISAAALPLPTGAAKETTLTTIAGYLDTEVAALVTAIQLLDNCISGNEAQVDVVAALPAGTNLLGKVGIDQTTPGTTNAVAPISGQAGIAGGTGVDGATVPRVTLATNVGLPAGTNAIGKLADNTGVDIGDVDVTSVVPGVAATNLGKAEDAVHASGDVGVMPLAVRNDDLAALGGADGDYAPVQVDADGAVYVNPAAAEPKRASGVAVGGAPGTDDIIAGVASRKIRILALGLFATSATVNNVFLDNADHDLLFNTANPLPLSLDADADTVPGFVLPYNPGGWMETDTVNEAVTLNSSAVQDIAWTVTYIEVP